jgi:large subunit ribosomal protein L21
LRDDFSSEKAATKEKLLFFTKWLREWDLVVYLHPFYKQINIIVMYAIVEIAGQQFKVSKDLKVYVHRLSDDEGAAISFAKVLLLDDNGTITLGAPAVEGASVEAKVLQHLKGDKVIVFKKKRRKGYKKRNGHRQYLTQIQISGITLPGAAPKKKAAAKKESEEVTEENN